MKVKALTSFVGAVCMAAGEIRDIEDTALLKDLKRAGYIKNAEKKGGVGDETK